MIEITGVWPNFEVDAVRNSLLDIMAATPLCMIATADSTGAPAASTAFYVLDSDEMVLHILTKCESIHGRNILQNGRAALTICSAAQGWSDAKRGVQLTATAGPTAAIHVEDALQRYLVAYPGLRKWVRRADEIETHLESRFFSFVIEHCKIIDEPAFGGEVSIDITLATRTSSLIATLEV